MSDPLQTRPDSVPPLFVNASTREVAGRVAARSIGKRHAQILDLLRTHGPLALFELAGLMGLHDHQISGRITELRHERMIEPTGTRRKKPDTGCEAEVYRLAELQEPDLGSVFGYPDSLTIEGQIFDRQPLCATESFPGIAYSRRSTNGLPRLTYRLILLSCPVCGKDFQLTGQRPDPLNAQATPKKLYACPQCKQQWELILTHEPGQPQRLALLLRTL